MTAFSDSAPFLLESIRPFTLRGATIVDPVAGTAHERDLFIDGVGHVADAPVAGSAEYDASGLVVMPPLADLHVHARDDILAAGDAGGFGVLVTMANSTPPVDSADAVCAIAATQHPRIRLLPASCVTRGRAGREVVDMEDIVRAGAVTFTDDGTMVADDDVMREAMSRAAALGVPVMDHAMVPSLMGRGVVRDCPAARKFGWPIVPPETETEAVARDIALSRETGCAAHLQHISCAGSVELIRKARAEGLRVSGEATPHHLLLCAEDIPGDDANWKMNPPLGTRADREAVRAAVLDGTLSVLATDHAPHPAAAKARGFREAPFGVVGLETALGASYQALVVESGMELAEFVRRWTVGPCEVVPGCRTVEAGFLQPGEPAGAFLVADFSTRRAVDPGRFRGGSVNSPFAGMRLPCVHGGLWRYAP